MQRRVIPVGEGNHRLRWWWGRAELLHSNGVGAVRSTYWWVRPADKKIKIRVFQHGFYHFICYNFKYCKGTFTILCLFYKVMSMAEIEVLKAKIAQLEQEINRLHKIMEQAGISYANESPTARETCAETLSLLSDDTPQPVQLTPRHANILYSYFKGRTDVYSKRAGKPNPKTGKYGYYTQCWNFWKEGICPKKDKVKIQCSKCKYQQYKPLRGKVLLEHLLGEKADGSDVIGIYPILPDETCNFLAFDFDNHADDEDDASNAWMEEADALRTICKEQKTADL